VYFGAHVGRSGGLAAAFRKGAAIGAETVQLFTQSPRAWRPNPHGPEAVAEYLQARREHPAVRSSFCHATYLINLAATDPTVGERSRDCLAHNLAVAGSIAADGLVLHLGSHLGAGLDACVKEVAGALLDALDALERPCRVLLENTAGGGGTIGRTFDELAAVLEAAGGDPRLGVCLDTQHLWASGVDFSSVDKADRVVADFDATVGLDRLDCIHLNDSKVPFGSQRDRHDNLGQGTIGAGGLAPMLGHPRLQGLPVLLEVAGPEGKGPTRADLATARRIHRVGLRRWAAG